LQDASNADRRGEEAPDATKCAWGARVSLIARIGVATAAILWVLWHSDWHKFVEVLRNLSPWYFGLGVVVYAAAQVVIAVRWWLLLRAQSIYISVLAAVRLFFLGLFYNNLMLGAVGGDLFKAWYVAKHTDKRLEGALSVFVDRAVGLVGTLLIAVFTYVVLLRGQIAGRTEVQEAGPAGWLAQHKGVMVLWAGGVVGAILLVLLAHPAGRARLAWAAERAWHAGVSLLRTGREALVAYCSRPWTLLWAMILTLVGQITVIAAFWVLGRNLGIEADLRYYLVAFPAGWIVGAIPVSPAGLGTTEAATIGLFMLLYPAAPAQVGALVICQRFIWLLASLPGGLVHLLGAHLPPQEISIDGPDRTN